MSRAREASTTDPLQKHTEQNELTELPENSETTKKTGEEEEGQDDASNTKVDSDTKPVPFIPPTVEALGNVSQIVVKSIHCNSHKGGKYQVLGENKCVLFQVRREWEPNTCNCFSCLKKWEKTITVPTYCDRNPQPIKFFVRDLMGQEVIITDVNYDSQVCCFKVWTAEVKLRPDIKIGTISHNGSWRKLTITNPAGDRLLKVEKEQKCCDKPMYLIFSLDGGQVGEISTELSKTRLKLTKEIDYKWKVLLLALTTVVQHEQEQSESKRQHQNPY